MVRIRDLADGAFWHLLGIEPIYQEDGKVILQVPVEEKLLQFYGKVHGGVVATLVDAAAAVALNRELGRERGATTVEMKVNYLRAVEKGVLYAEGSLVHLGRTLAVANARVWDDSGREIAFGVATYYLLDMTKE
jgi:acyl-CoA thioesterase